MSSKVTLFRFMRPSPRRGKTLGKHGWSCQGGKPFWQMRSSLCANPRSDSVSSWALSRVRAAAIAIGIKPRDCSAQSRVDRDPICRHLRHRGPDKGFGGQWPIDARLGTMAASLRGADKPRLARVRRIVYRLHCRQALRGFGGESPVPELPRG